MRYSTCRTTRRRSARSSSGGRSNRMPALLMLCLARLMRWAIVASGTRNAFAISAVVRPPSSVGAFQFRREVESHARALDALLGPADALGHRGLWNQECVRDLRGGQAADGAEREGQLRRYGQRGMAAQEEQGESVVVRRDSLGRQLQGRCGFLPTTAGAFAAPRVDQAPGSDGHQPRSRVVGRTCLGPLEGGREQSLLHGVLAGVELPVPLHQGAEDLRRQLTQHVLDLCVRPQNSGGASITRRTSIGTLTKATMREAISSARASFSTSTIQ